MQRTKYHETVLWESSHFFLATRSVQHTGTIVLPFKDSPFELYHLYPTLSIMSGNTLRLSREDYKKKRELDELRKAGAAPAELDEDGNMINRTYLSISRSLPVRRQFMVFLFHLC